MLETTDRRHQASMEGSRRQGPTTEAEATAIPDPDATWLSLARNAYESGKNWFDSSIRKQVERNYDLFHSQHPAGSKYHTETYAKKSKLFRPKTRAMVRRSEAATAIAFFGTQDAVHVSAINDTNADQRDAAEVHNAILNYRLDDPRMFWFQTVIGASQDAYVQGTVISKQVWHYQTRKTPVAEVYEEADGTNTFEFVTDEEVMHDKPCVILVPIENLRVDPAAAWYDPINTSPYLVELVPTYIYEVHAKMRETNPRTGKKVYRGYTDNLLGFAIQQDWDSIRRARETDRVDRYEADSYVNEFQTVWVHKNIIRVGDRDYCYDTLGTELVLSDPEPMEEVYPHTRGRYRPYAFGTAVVEAHKLYSTAPVQITEPLQEEINDLANLRMDNIRLALLKRYFYRRGMGVDLPTLLRNVPGSAIAMTSTEDVKETQPQDVTSSSFEEHNRLALDFDEVSGNFSSASVGTNRQLNETVGGMSLLSSDAAQLKEYEIRTFSETWLEQVVRQLVDMEATFEDDAEVLENVAGRTGLPLERIMQVIGKRTAVKANVGFNSTNPEKRVGKLMLALEALAKFMPQTLQDLDAAELVKEIFGAVGYRDGARFFPKLAAGGQEDPRVRQLQEQVAQLMQYIETEQVKQQGAIEVARIGAESRVAAASMNAEVAMVLGQMKAGIEGKRMRLEEFDRMLEVETQDVKRRELYLQREALSHEINESNREFMLKIQQFAHERTQPPERQEGPKPTAGGDKAGVISRDNFGLIPQAAG